MCSSYVDFNFFASVQLGYGLVAFEVSYRKRYACMRASPLLLLLRTAISGSVAEWLACWTQAQKGLGSNRSHDAVG